MHSHRFPPLSARAAAGAALALVALLVSVAPARAACAGDCGLDGVVAVNELITGVGIALGSLPLGACANLDVDGDQNVTVNELVAAVQHALFGCPTESTPTPTITGAAPATATPTATPTTTPTATPTLAVGPQIVFFGLTAADDSLQSPSGTDPGGVPIYERPFGFSFSLVVEAAPGSAGFPIGRNALSSGPPDLQIQATRALGNGSPEVCDVNPPQFGGVPGIDPPNLEDPAAIADALNDFGCRFIDGEGQPVARTCNLGCVRFVSGDFGCVDDTALVQFCGQVAMPLSFPPGDTLVTARVRDNRGNLGPPAQLIVRVTQ